MPFQRGFLALADAVITLTVARNANSAGAATLLLARGCDYVLGSAAAAGDGLPPERCG